MIEEKKLYPITYLKGVRALVIREMTTSGTIILKQLIEIGPEELNRKTGISKESLELMIGKARLILS